MPRKPYTKEQQKENAERYELAVRLGSEFICSHCGESKQALDFHRDKSKRNGASSRCKLCERARADKTKSLITRDDFQVFIDQGITKTCGHCKEDLSLDNFYFQATGGYHCDSTCKSCCAERQRVNHTKPAFKARINTKRRRYVAKNRQKIVQYQAEYFQKRKAKLTADPDKIEEKKAYTRNYYQKNKEKLLAYQKERRDNPEQRKVDAERRKRNRDKQKDENSPAYKATLAKQREYDRKKREGKK